MADPSSYRPAPGQIPDSPGVYRFRDEHRRVIYVGKAKSLRQRLANYFQDLAGLHPRTRTMVTTAASVEWTVVSTEVEALQLEYSWIKEYDPRFNVKYRDDKSYPYLAVTMNEEFPRAQVMRGAKRKGVRYFGPYGHAWAIRDTVDLLLRVFPVRTCSAGVFKNAARTGRPCLLGYIDKCSAPCVGRISPEDHRDLAEDFCHFMAGHTGTYLRRLEERMTEAAEDMEYERAARLRDDIGALTRAMEKSAVVLADATDADLIALAQDELEAAVQIFHVRGGRVRGQRGWVTDKVEAVTTGDLVEHALQQLYGEERGDAVPKEVLVPALPDPVRPVQEWLSERRGAQVSLRVPQRGDKRALMETVERNAQQSLALHKTRRASDLTTRSRALEEIAAALDLDGVPLRIECYDISHLQGDDVVASMVVFEDGLARKSEYRRFQIKGFQGQDDVRSMHEVITRRFRRYLAERERTGEWTEAELDGPVESGGLDEDGRPKRFAYPPQLLVVDGGQPQVAAARRALDELGIDDVAVCGLAKRLEEVWVPGEEDPVVLPRSSEGLYLLQRVRDEAHRFAITYQRSKRAKRFRAGPLDEVPGLGQARKQALLKHFGSVRKLRAATIEQICEVPGIGRKTAETILATFARSEPGTPAVNMTTGEILDDGSGDAGDGSEEGGHGSEDAGQRTEPPAEDAGEAARETAEDARETARETTEAPDHAPAAPREPQVPARTDATPHEAGEPSATAGQAPAGPGADDARGHSAPREDGVTHRERRAEETPGAAPGGGLASRETPGHSTWQASASTMEYGTSPEGPGDEDVPAGPGAPTDRDASAPEHGSAPSNRPPGTQEHPHTAPDQGGGPDGRGEDTPASASGERRDDTDDAVEDGRTTDGGRTDAAGRTGRSATGEHGHEQ
ncbi:excinuclease ABC subunit UvrC [Streptomyces sp. SID11385]|uniref:excinuclease ABC subunit UvrC n=1 Tax=Streptomyces sp. SID11385 TaxID=2706031 RepID=UPI0013C63FCB|nr:excinuclease ABC subunit UvrC [Streptomyces sp. SID11385]NEA38965.1 excinuclease ABC subunit UvrC [Streptomyces sp. SID11385]